MSCQWFFTIIKTLEKTWGIWIPLVGRHPSQSWILNHSPSSNNVLCGQISLWTAWTFSIGRRLQQENMVKKCERSTHSLKVLMHFPVWTRTLACIKFNWCKHMRNRSISKLPFSLNSGWIFEILNNSELIYTASMENKDRKGQEFFRMPPICVKFNFSWSWISCTTQTISQGDI